MLGLVKFITGVFLAIALLFVAGVATTRYLITKLTTNPERPVFENEAGAVPPATPPSAPAPTATPTPPAPTPTPTPQEAAQYQAVVTQPIGLIVRSDPNPDAQRVSGLAYNAQVEILGESDDQQWLRIRIPGSDTEGWIKAGNTQPVNE